MRGDNGLKTVKDWDTIGAPLKVSTTASETEMRIFFCCYESELKLVKSLTPEG